MFKSRAELNGELDKKIWRGGSVNPDKKEQTRRSQVQSELSSLIRKLRPHQSKAIQVAVGILDNKEIAYTNTALKASALMMGVYRDLLKDLHNLPDEKEGETVEELIEKPKFSLHMITPEKKE